MVAQAHAATKKYQSQGGEDAAQPQRVPHPPSGAPSKPLTAHPHRSNARFAHLHIYLIAQTVVFLRGCPSHHLVSEMHVCVHLFLGI